MENKSEYHLNKPYSKGPINIIKPDRQIIRISAGCPWKHPYCAESYENPIPIIYGIPEIKRNYCQLVDMNLLSHPESLTIIEQLGKTKYHGQNIRFELVCGIDYRFLNQKIAIALKKAHFIKMRLAWDGPYIDIQQIFSALKLLLAVGYIPKDIMIFVLCNWKISYNECCYKLDFLKFLNVKVCDCYFDNQVSPNIKPVYWSLKEIRDFRKRCRDHNLMSNHQGIHPDLLRGYFTYLTKKGQNMPNLQNFYI